jgi:O-antigen/teichoic acid export membrane protein
MTSKQWFTSLLRKSESIFKTDMVYATSGGFWLTFGQIFTNVFSLALSIAFANLISKEDYGTYRYILSVAGIIGSFSLSGLSTAVTRAAAKGVHGGLKQAFIANMKYGFILSLAMFMGALYYYLQGNITLALGLLFAGTLSPLADSGELFNAFLNGTKEFKKGAFYRIVRALTNSSLLIATIFIFPNPIALSFVYFAGNAGTAYLLYRYTLKHSVHNNTQDPDMRQVGIHVSITNALAAFVDQIDEILVFHYLGAAQLAIYTYALIFPNTILGFVKNISILAVPKFVKISLAEGRRHVREKQLSLFLLSAPIAIAYIVLAPLFFHTFFPKYEASILYSQVFALNIFITGVLITSFLDAHKAIHARYWLILYSNAFKLVAVFLGIYFYGIWGAIAARILAKYLGVVLGYRAIKLVSS